MKFFNKSIVAAALLVASGFMAQSAFAATTPIYTLTPDGFGGYGLGFSDGLITSSTFDDKFGFAIGTNFDSSGSVTSTVSVKSSKGLADVVFTLVEYTNTTTKIVATAVDGGATGGNTYLVFNDLPTLAAGNYFLEVTGKLASGAKSGSYGGQFDITTAVPEPETYAMLAAGLGLMGFMVRRNKKQA